MKEERLKKEAYRKYQLDWISNHGYSVKDIIDEVLGFGFPGGAEDYQPYNTLLESGINGELFAGFYEFCNNEYLDSEYIYSLLSGADAKEYQLNRVRDWILEQIEEKGCSAKDKYGFSVPKRLLMPNQIVWSWPADRDLCSILQDIVNEIQAFKKERTPVKELLGDTYKGVRIYDDDQPTGGISFPDETLGEFMEEIGIDGNIEMMELEKIMHDCGVTLWY